MDSHYSKVGGCEEVEGGSEDRHGCNGYFGCLSSRSEFEYSIVVGNRYQRPHTDATHRPHTPTPHKLHTPTHTPTQGRKFASFDREPSRSCLKTPHHTQKIASF